jgi:PRTRC genetic system protein C
MEKTTLKWSFSFNGLRLPEPNERMSVEEVKSFYANQYPELTTAAISGPEIIGDVMRYTFSRAVGTKG